MDPNQSKNIPLLDRNGAANQVYDLDDAETGDVGATMISSNGAGIINTAKSSNSLQSIQNGALHKNDIPNSKRQISDGADTYFPLHDAAKKGRLEECQNLLAKPHIDINAKNNETLTALHVAVQNKKLEVIKVLIKKGANVSETDRFKCIPLHYAAETGFQKGCEVLMEGNKSKDAANKKNQNGKTPFMLAAVNGHLSICEAMRYADLNIKDKVNDTVLHLVAASGSENTLSWLLSQITVPTQSSTLEAKNNKGFTPILVAAKKGHLEIVERLETKGADINETCHRNKNILHIASFGKNYKLMNYLLDKPKLRTRINELDKDEVTPLLYALRNQSMGIAELLMKKGAIGSFPDSSDSPLHLAALHGYKNVVKEFLIKGDISVNNTNKEGNTPLHMAVKNRSSNSKDICQLLIKNGANMEEKNLNKQIPLHMAAELGNVNSLQRLTLRRPDKITNLLRKDGEGNTALHIATNKDSIDCCKVLVAREPSINTTKNENGKYACQVALEQKKYDIFKFLIRKIHLADENDGKELLTDIHQYVHDALKSNQENSLGSILEAIVKSELWLAAFYTEDCKYKEDYKFCNNFIDMCEKYPALANLAQDKCIREEKTPSCVTKYNFQIYEGLKPNSEESGTPHDITSDWMKNHPLTKLVSLVKGNKSLEKGNKRCLTHDLTRVWIISRWKGYIWKIFTVFIVIQTLLALLVTIHLKMAWNWDFILHKYSNVTEQEICSNKETSSSNEILEWLSARHGVGCSLFIVYLICIGLEINYILKMRICYDNSLRPLFRWLQHILIFVFIIPISKCNFQLMIIPEFSWMAGIAAMLLSWMIMINILNKIPILTVFMPLSKMFLASFVKILVFFFMIISAFALVFNLLIYNNKAFLHWIQAFIKTITWMLGDLSYDDTFVEEKPYYLVSANMYFLIFIFTMAMLLSNFVVTLPSNSFDDFRKKSEILKYADCVEIILALCVCFPCISKKYPLYEYEFKGLGSRVLQVNTMNKALEEENTQNEHKDLKKEICKLPESINKNLVNMQNELEDLKMKICMLTDTVNKLVDKRT